MLNAILKFFTSSTIQSIGEQINRWQEIKAKAKNDHERLEADKMLAELEASKNIIQSSQADKYERFVRIAWAAPFIIYNTKLLVWDKVFSLGSTDPLSTELIELQTVIVGGYFLYSIVRR